MDKDMPLGANAIAILTARKPAVVNPDSLVFVRGGVLRSIGTTRLIGN